jgi:hypothetical protein
VSAWDASVRRYRDGRSGEAGSQAGGVEVEQQARWEACELQIRDDLRQMHRMNPVRRLDLDHESAIHEEITFQIIAHPFSPVEDRYAALAFDE